MLKTFFKRYWLWIVVFFGLSALYFCTRLVHLTIIPIFTDEAIYLRWAQSALAEPRWRFISLIDGKQPLLIWLFLPALKLIGDPLVAGRVVSVVLGYVGMFGVMVFASFLTKNYKGALIGGLFYIVSPFFLMYDRLAIYESLLTAIFIWTLFLTYVLGKTLRLDVALLLGMSIGAGLLTKSSATFFWGLLPAMALLVGWRKNTWKLQTLKLAGLILITTLLGMSFTLIFYLSEFRHMITAKNLTFVYSLAEFMQKPFLNAWGNFVGLSSWLVGYLSIPVLLLMVVAFVWYFKKNWKSALFFLTYFIVPFVALAWFGRVIYPRFILFMTVPLWIVLIIYCTHLVETHKKKLLLSVLIVALFMPSVYFSVKLLTDPIQAPIPKHDRSQFISDWPAGYGIKEVVGYLKTEADKGPIVVATDGTFGLYPMALEIYLGSNPNISFKPYWPLNDFPYELKTLAQEKPVYLLFKEKQVAPPDWPIVLIAQYQRGDGPTYLKFFRVVP